MPTRISNLRPRRGSVGVAHLRQEEVQLQRQICRPEARKTRIRRPDLTPRGPRAVAKDVVGSQSPLGIVGLDWL